MEYVTSVKVIKPYILEVTFTDGSRRGIDLEPELWGTLFAPLRDPALFAQACVDEDFGTVCWPNGADIAPEFLYEHGESVPQCARA